MAKISIFKQNCMFTDKHRRYSSFSTFPEYSPIYPSRLANAGFEYEGNDDEVICSICSLRYKNWNKGVDPFSVHSKRSPFCKFVKNFKAMISFSSGCVQDFISLKVFIPSPVRQTSFEHINNMRIVWEHPIIKKIMEMGYSKDIIQRAAEDIGKKTGMCKFLFFYTDN